MDARIRVRKARGNRREIFHWSLPSSKCWHWDDGQMVCSDPVQTQPYFAMSGTEFFSWVVTLPVGSKELSGINFPGNLLYHYHYLITWWLWLFQVITWVVSGHHLSFRQCSLALAVISLTESCLFLRAWIWQPSNTDFLPCPLNTDFSRFSKSFDDTILCWTFILNCSTNCRQLFAN